MRATAGEQRPEPCRQTIARLFPRPQLSRDSWHGQRIGDALAVEIDERVMHGLVERGDVREGPVGE